MNTPAKHSQNLSLYLASHRGIGDLLYPFQESDLLIRLFCIIIRMVFFIPVRKKPQADDTSYIFINFSAWEYVGSDHTWAGLVTTLCDVIEKRDRILMSVFRVFGSEVKVEIKESCNKKENENKWVVKTYMTCLLCTFLLIVFLLLLCLIFFSRDTVVNILIPTGTAISTIYVTGFAFPVVKNLIFTLKGKLEKEMNRKDFSSQLGFMHNVKTEVEVITNFLQFMAFYKQKEICVVLKVTNLDICTPDKVVGVLDAMNILLSDKDAPFISILAVDPSIMTECIEKSHNMFSNGYEYLNRIITLPFSLPQMNKETKLHLLQKITRSKGRSERQHNNNVNHQENNSAEDSERSHTYNEQKIPIEAFQYLKKIGNEYMPGNNIQMKRIVNTLINIRLMISMGFQTEVETEKNFEVLVNWVILANNWPCRLSWILQCVEDDWQRNQLSETNVGSQEDANLLLDIYNNNSSELDKIKTKIEKLLELDGDPDLFRNFLKTKKFTVKHVKQFSNLTINLDSSLKRRLELIRSMNGITSDKLNQTIPHELCDECQ
uniref:KAP NTPase domain-containing protein n=1 Tax=Terrapene triunguis TaxID=2587831 RepID=A0A674IKI3_9SAUR